MSDLMEFAAKCRNPVVRNALLAVAATGQDEELADRLARVEIKTASRDAKTARAEHARICDDIHARGAKGNPKYADPMIAEYVAISDADSRAHAARVVRNALRMARREADARQVT
jgi:hypothetical protein